MPWKCLRMIYNYGCHIKWRLISLVHSWKHFYLMFIYQVFLQNIHITYGVKIWKCNTSIKIIKLWELSFLCEVLESFDAFIWIARSDLLFFHKNEFCSVLCHCCPESGGPQYYKWSTCIIPSLEFLVVSNLTQSLKWTLNWNEIRNTEAMRNLTHLLFLSLQSVLHTSWMLLLKSISPSGKA